MSRRSGAGFLALLVLLALLPPPGHGNEGSVIGSCYCHWRISSDSPPKGEVMAHFRKHLRAYDRCNSYIRFQLHSRSVCGGSKDAWVQELVSWFDRKERGYANSGSAAPQELLPPPSTQIPEPTQGVPLDTGSPAPTYLPLASQSTAQPTLPAGARSSDRNLTHTDDITTSTEGHGRGPGERQKQLEERVGPSGRTSATVPVASLLTIIFILTVVLLYVLCKRRREPQSLQHSPDLPLYYTPVASDSNV